MKKPDFCPEWFNIDLYESNLPKFQRDDFATHLFYRRLEHRILIKNEHRHPDRVKGFDEQGIIFLATEALKERAESDKVYNVHSVMPDIIQEAKFIDVFQLYVDCYLKFPIMRKLFNHAQNNLVEFVESGIIECDFFPKYYMPEDTSKNELKEIDEELERLLNTDLNYSTTVHIELSVSDEVIIEAFKKKLSEIRARENSNGKRFSDAAIQRIVDYKIFPFIDLYLWSLYTGRKFTDIEMAAMLYPPRNNTPLDFDAVDRIARTTRPRALSLLNAHPHLFL